MLSTRRKGCFSLHGVRPIYEFLRGHGGGKLGVTIIARARIILMGTQVARTDRRVFKQVVSL